MGGRGEEGGWEGEGRRVGRRESGGGWVGDREGLARSGGGVMGDGRVLTPCNSW